LSHHYPTSAPLPPPHGFPWTRTLNGKPISQSTADGYVKELKKYVTPNIRTLLYDYAHWNAEKAGWYNQPWLANLQEPIRGAYKGLQFPPNALPGQSQSMTTFVMTYYDHRAAASLGRVWGATAMNPVPALKKNAAQFDEGSVIVKLATNTLTGSEWPAMKGAAQLQLYTDPSGECAANELFPVSFFQLDIVVKDSIASPETQWVYTCLVFDNRHTCAEAPDGKCADAWDQMVPFGAMWGNDPRADSGYPTRLSQTWINPAFKDSYAVATLGWNGRLAGPNDGAVQPVSVNGKTVTLADSSCLSCHGSAEFPMKSFLVPAPAGNETNKEKDQDQMPPPIIANGVLVSYAPSSPQWDRWFQSRNGSTAMDEGSIALDYDMVYAIKSLPAWAEATHQDKALQLPALLLAMEAKRRGFPANALQYHGRP
jgi:hypothetical protein